MIKIFENLAAEYAALLQQLITEKLEIQESFTWALSGGNTPIKLFDILAAEYNNQIDWKRIKIFWGDERCVAPNHADSNYFQAFKHLLSHVPVPRTNVFRIKGEAPPELELTRYAALLNQELDAVAGIPALDLNMLGIGTDGHTASIFPGQEALFESEEYCGIGKHPQSGQLRITMTGKIILQSKNIHVLASGESKADIIRQVVVNKSSDYPISRINQQENLVWILDQPAARFIKKPHSK